MGGDRHGRMKRAAPGSVRTVPPVGWRPGLGKRGHLASSRQEGGLSANGRPFREVSGLTGRTFRAFSGLTVRQPTKRDEKAARKCLLLRSGVVRCGQRRRPHNPKVAGSNPAPATTGKPPRSKISGASRFSTTRSIHGLLYAHELGLLPITTSAYSAEDNGLTEPGGVPGCSYSKLLAVSRRMGSTPTTASANRRYRRYRRLI